MSWLDLTMHLTPHAAFGIGGGLLFVSVLAIWID
jgi:hypothetical protein